MSNIYKEELDKIIMNEEMKKRILHNVLNENVQAKVTKQSKKKHNVLKRNIGVAAACFTAVICLGVVQNYPEIFMQGNKTLKQEEISKNIDNEKNDLQNSEAKIPQNSENDNNKNYDSKNDDNNINNDNAQKRENTNQSSSIEKKSQKSENENYGDKNSKKIETNNENSSKAKEKEKTSRNPESTSSVSSSNVKPESEPDYNTESKNLKKSNNVKNDDSESQNDMSDDNGKSTDEVMNDTSVSQDEVTGNAPMMTYRANYEEEYKTIEEAESAVNFRINNIKILPEGFNIDQIDVISNQIIQIQYSDGKDIINFRAGKGSHDISGDYNIYEVENNLIINGESVNFKGNKDGQINLAVWEKGDISYSISSTSGIKEEEISEMIKSAV